MSLVKLMSKCKVNASSKIKFCFHEEVCVVHYEMDESGLKLLYSGVIHEQINSGGEFQHQMC